jgi:CheY-like chemotaxis protein
MLVFALRGLAMRRPCSLLQANGTAGPVHGRRFAARYAMGMEASGSPHVSVMPAVLIVDDAAESREPVARMLNREGIVTWCVSNGQQGLDLLGAIDVDLILLDLCMPVMDGIEMLRRLRRDSFTRRIPVIVFTALTDREPIDQARALGAREVLYKSRFSGDDLLRAVRRQLGWPDDLSLVPITPSSVFWRALTGLSG